MPSVLIVDVEEQLRKLLARTIGLEGFEVIEAGTCKVALKKLEQRTEAARLLGIGLTTLYRKIEEYRIA